MPPSEVERIATLEEIARTATNQRHEMIERMDVQDGELSAIRQDVHAIRTTLAGYRGFVAGAWFALATLGGLVGSALTALWGRIFGQ